MTFPLEWSPMPGDDATPGERDGAWRAAFATPELDADSEAFSMVASRLTASVPHATVVSVMRVQVWLVVLSVCARGPCSVRLQPPR